jgi:hypothetical protein
MKKQVVSWKPIRSRNRLGEVFISDSFPQLIDCAYRGELLFEIVSMIPKTPISFEHAVNIIEKEYFRASSGGQWGPNPGQANWYYRNFVQWISDQGYCIELTGDEFETASICGALA